MTERQQEQQYQILEFKDRLLIEKYKHSVYWQAEVDEDEWAVTIWGGERWQKEELIKIEKEIFKGGKNEKEYL